MGNELVSSLFPTDEETIQPTRKYYEIFYEQFPFYLSIGMTYEQYWEGDSSLVKYYRDAFLLQKDRKNEEIYVIGGGEVYKALLPYCHEVLVTKVDAVGGAEVFFPNLDMHPDFICVDEGEPVDDNGLTIRFTRYKNTAVKGL